MNGNNSIENVVIVGMGALGLMFGERIAQNIGREHLRFLMDEGRRQRHADDLYTINGNRVSFQMTLSWKSKFQFGKVNPYSADCLQD